MIPFTRLILLITIIFAIFHRNGNAQSPQELLGVLRQQVLRLELTGQIKRDYEHYIQPEIKDGEEYDFIVIGAGSSGTALVRRLSEILHWKILLIEAGGEPDILTDIPYWSLFTEFTDLDWGYIAEKEDNIALGLKNQKMVITKGKGLGGTSLLNNMIFTRGAKEEYDRWASLGNPGWSYEEVLPFFAKLENCSVAFRDYSYRGRSGPISVEDAYLTTPGRSFIESANNLGYDYVDYNGRTNRGVSRLQQNTKNGLRCSGEKCYIRPVKYRKNLVIQLHSFVTKILIKDKTAYGIQFSKDGKNHVAYAKKEVILSAGPIASPQILLLSGIGPKGQLRRFGIKPIRNLPVGQKMYDHVAYLPLGFTFNQSIEFNKRDALKDDAFIELFNEGKGPLRSNGGFEAVVFTRSRRGPSRFIDIEIVGANVHVIAKTNNTGLDQVSDETYEYSFRPYDNQSLGSCSVTLLHPRSYGRVELRSADPFVHPKIYTGFFTDPGNNDIKTMIAGIREATRIMLSPPFNRYDSRPMDRPILGCQHYRFDSDEYWECAIRHLARSVYHPISTCKMGPAYDPEAVVDYKLRVYGLHRLRVVDTSIIPITLSGHTNAPAFLVGEKASDIIKRDYSTILSNL